MKQDKNKSKKKSFEEIIKGLPTSAMTVIERDISELIEQKYAYCVDNTDLFNFMLYEPYWQVWHDIQAIISDIKRDKISEDYAINAEDIDFNMRQEMIEYGRNRNIPFLIP